MQTPKSKFIKNEIKNLKLNKENKSYIEDLIFLEQAILLDGRVGWAGGIRANCLTREYRKEYNAIFKELKPKEFEKVKKRELKEKRKQEEEDKRFEAEEKEELKNDKILWKKLGGKLSK